MEIINRSPKELKKADYNPRKISDKDFKQLKKSLSTFQCVEPVVVNQFEGRENVIVGGHQRLKAMIDLGWDEVPTIEVYLNQDEEKELNVRLNKNTGEFDLDMLTDLFDTDKLEQIGFDIDDLPDITEDLSVLDELDEADLDKMSEGLRKAIMVDFDEKDYQEAFELFKWFREQGYYLGEIIVEGLIDEKARIEKIKS